MPRGERVTVSGFARFMASMAGRLTRAAVGVALIVAGVLIGGIGGWVLGAFGLLLVAAGVLDFCLITGLIDNVWSGREVRARSGGETAPHVA